MIGAVGGRHQAQERAQQVAADTDDDGDCQDRLAKGQANANQEIAFTSLPED